MRSFSMISEKYYKVLKVNYLPMQNCEKIALRVDCDVISLPRI